MEVACQTLALFITQCLVNGVETSLWSVESTKVTSRLMVSEYGSLITVMHPGHAHSNTEGIVITLLG